MRLSNYLIVSLLMVSRGTADVIITFEDLPSDYMFFGGDQNIGSFYDGVTFGANVTGLDLTGSMAYPPHSGSIAVWDPSDLSVTISFDSPQAMVGVWYTSFDPLTLSAYDTSDTLLSSTTGLANTDGTTGASYFLSLTTPNISMVTLTGSPGNYVFDDVTFSQDLASVPEPGSIQLLLPVVALILACRARLLDIRN